MEMADRIAGFYEAFNNRDVPTLLAAMTADVRWPNGWEGGTVHGRDEVREYWRRQFAEIDPTVVPIGLVVEDDGRVAVAVHQVVRDLSGATVTERAVTHVYRFTADDLVSDMEIRD
jgi:ketosteroid isomerase-like protein